MSRMSRMPTPPAPDWDNTSAVLGLDGLLSVMREATAHGLERVSLYGPVVGLALLIGALYLLLYRALRWLILRLTERFVADPTRRSIWQHFSLLVLRLTLWMLGTVSVLAIVPGVNGYAGPTLRVYLLLLTLLAGWSAIRFFLNRQASRWNLDGSLALLLGNVLRGLWLLLGIYLIFSQFGINLVPILGGLGVVGLAVGFAAQDILANLISGITLLLDRPFRIGDWIRTAEREGQVIGITLRTTRIRTRDNEYISIPNKELAGAVVTNLTQGGMLRLNVSVPVGYGTDIAAARAALLAVMQAHPKVIQEERPPQVLVRELGESSVELILRFWVTDEDVASYPVITMQLREAARAALDATDAEVPRQQVQLHWNGERAPDGTDTEEPSLSKKNKGR